MHGAQEFLTALTIVLCVAAVTTFAFQKLRQPVVLGYILAGLVIGPHLPVPVIASPAIVHTLSELGVILLMFGLGLEFSLGKLFRAAPTAGITSVIQCSVMVLLGYLAGQALGWTTMESIFAGAMIASSSTTIIAKAFDEQNVRGSMRDLVVAILICEDLIAILLMALLTGVATGSGLSAEDLAVTMARLLGFLIAVVGIGLLVIPRVMRLVVGVGRNETIVIAAVGICFGISLLAHEVGYSVALGAFLAGMLVAESGEVRIIEPLVNPVRDVFAAVFFVSVGMMIDPQALVDHWVAIIAFTLIVILGKLVSVPIGALLVGSNTRTAVAAGMSLSQIGEFAFIIAGLGLSLGVIGDFMYPIAVAVSAVTTLTTPWLIRISGSAGAWVDRKMPRPLQLFITLYAGWIERLRASRGNGSVTRGLIRTLLLEVFAVAAIVIAIALGFGSLVGIAVRELSLDVRVARIALAVLGGALVLPFCIGILGVTRRLAAHLSNAIVPQVQGASVDLGRAPRLVLVAALRLAGVLIAGLPLVAVTQPFLPRFAGAAVLITALVVLAVMFWRKARDLDGHVRAASHVILEALAAQSSADASHGHHDPASHPEVDALLPGLTQWHRVDLPPGSPAVGRSLAELQLRGTTGATVLALSRDGGGMGIPDASEPLREGDVLAITGTEDAIAAATALLRGA